MRNDSREPRRVLFFLPDLDSPPSKGYQVRCIGIAHGLTSRYSARMVCARSSPVGEGLGADKSAIRRAESLLVSLRRGLPLQTALFDGPDVANKIARLVTNWDPHAVVLVTERLAHSLLAFNGIPLIIDAVDPMELQMSARAAHSGGLRARIFRRESRLFHRNADRILRRAARVVVSSRTAASYFPGSVVIENAARVDTAPRPEPTIDVLFSGTLSYWPNVKGALEICKTITPRVRSSLPHARIVIAGRNPAAAVQRACLTAGVELLPNVEDISAVIRSARLALAPIEWTPGGNLKVYEALAAGTPVLAYPVAAAEVGAGQGVAVCNGPVDMADKAIAFLNGAVQIPISDRSVHTWPSRARQFEALLDQVLS